MVSYYNHHAQGIRLYRLTLKHRYTLKYDSATADVVLNPKKKKKDVLHLC